MNPFLRFAGVALVAALAIGAAAVVLRPAANVGPAIPSHTIEPVTAAPTPPGQPTELTAGPLEFGTYVGPTLQVADIIADVNADPTLTAADRTQIIDVLLDIKGKTTLYVSLEFRGGQLTQREIIDDIPTIGSLGRYAFPDEETLVYTETINDVGVVTEFDLAVDGDSFTLHRTTPARGAADEFVTRLLFESGPFVLE